ncbi:MAG: DNA repair protein RecO [Bacteroidota bacterium]|jgi:DNA repair protein RecO (recombination protein O)
MSSLHHTKGIVLRTVKYGETSLVVSIFTEMFGLQQYMVNGVRTSKKNPTLHAAQLQPGSLLDLIVYHNDRQTLQRIKESKQLMQHEDNFSNITRNAILLYMLELLQNCLKQPDAHAELFYFLEDILSGLYKADESQLANLPLFFTIHLSHFFGFRLMDNFSPLNQYLDLKEGQFVSSSPSHQLVIQPPLSEKVAQLLRALQIGELGEVKLNRHQRTQLMDDLLQFYSMHIHPFMKLKSLTIIRSVLED